MAPESPFYVRIYTMKITGHLRKMQTTYDSPVSYHLPLDNELIEMNPLLGKHIMLSYQGVIHCIACGRKASKSYNQGYCFPCFRSLARCDLCIMKPETCHYHQGTCREPAWGEEQCFQDHFVYLANSSALKVGITRGTQVPTRWIDQGATQALPLFRVSNRLISGKLEVMIKTTISDRTDWRKMLKQDPPDIDLQQKSREIIEQELEAIQSLRNEYGDDAIRQIENAEVIDIDYPILEYPKKVTSLNFDKTPDIAGTLKGIKGQYLILDTGVLNIRKFAGYSVELTVEN